MGLLAVFQDLFVKVDPVTGERRLVVSVALLVVLATTPVLLLALRWTMKKMGRSLELQDEEIELQRQNNQLLTEIRDALKERNES